MNSYFAPSFFQGNRERLRTLFTGKAPIVLTGNNLLQRNSDIAYPFRQDSNFWYLTGLTEPDIILVMDKDREYLITPERSNYRNIFNGGIDTRALSGRSGITEILDTKEGWKRLDSRLERVRHVATVAAPPAYIEHYEFFSNPAKANLITRLKSVSTELELLDLREHFARMRVVKQACEIDAIKASVDLTVRTFKKLKPKLDKMRSEYEVEAFINSAFRSNGAQSGYESIVAGGMNACTLHYNSNNNALTPHELLLIDAGAEQEYYSADITRTYALGEPTKRQRAIHNAVTEVRRYVLSYLKPGVSIKESEKLVEQFMGEKLRTLGLIKIIDRDSVRKYFPHATSHFLGLDLHDAGNYERPLESGMVLTVEPGIYIPEENIGVRIEDDIVITKNGAKNLSANLPHSLQ